MHSFYFFGVKKLNLNQREQAAWGGWDLGYPLQRLRAPRDAGTGLGHPVMLVWGSVSSPPPQPGPAIPSFLVAVAWEIQQS